MYTRCQTSICLGEDAEWGRHISELVFRSYGSHGSVYYDRDEWKFASSSTVLFNDLARYYQPKWNARVWRVSPHLSHSPIVTKRRFVRGYFDADGYPNFNKARRKVLVQVNSVNKIGLSDVRNLLKTIGFHPGLYRRYKKREVWELVIHRKSEVNRFLQEVGFAIKRKQSKFQETLNLMDEITR